MEAFEDDGFILINNPSSTPSSDATDHLAAISAYVDGLADALWPINVKIHDHPELGFKEKIAHAALTAFLETQDGWQVQRSAYGLETAFVAVFEGKGKGKGPVVSFNAEMDALPEIGHACGHNLIAIASLAGALAAARVMEEEDLPGKVVLFGTPAEEGGGGKIKLIEAGAYRDHKVGINLISHPGTAPDTALMHTAAYTRFKVEYFGRETHAAASPWLGINALDALITAYNALSVLRQQTQPGDIIQGHITSGGLAPNIIHAYAAGVFVVRANTSTRLAELKRKVDACFAGAATATGAALKTTPEGAYKDHVPNRTLGRCYRQHFNRLGGAIPDPEVDEVRGRTMASTDQGDVSYVLPSLSPGFWIRPGVSGNGPHSPEFEKASGTREAFDLALRVGKGLAATAVDVLTKEGLVGEVRKEWEREVKGKE
ncbi:uncharacterized protein K452DRAFT_354005 [Aplosporella prunicola CBS 121167]|uniref:Peptidase M20 domain-containing protein 2 n=1 Tax=Aplosporella prunicola CBS 121167 TaxID=1176127 RepID=A0A6A6AZE4_9PEZI|nr:uncharacterized protein K452DRAFT_354005 [Aplosporella prunicola CBS 121167]KAF2136325.1 hypothetical protein K452DRAFT_354005 [Aplosporella prunicola CBS 121167]